MARYFLDFWTNELEEKIGFLEKTGGGNPLVTGLEYDSRLVQKGSLYFALPGLHTDGHKFIDSAIERGAAVIVHQSPLTEYKKDIVYIRVQDTRFGMSAISAAFYDYPSKHLCIIGVTGTEGKSTTVYLIFQLLRLAGKKAGFISTVQFSVDGTEQWNSEHQTTPEAAVINKYLARMVENGMEYAIIEASSHGLSPLTNRLGDIDFDIAVMTNVTHEHLEFHGTWEQYRHDKANLFRSLDRAGHDKLIQNSLIQLPSFGVVNADDPSAAYFIQASAKKVFSYSTQGKAADMSADHIISRGDGNEYEIHCGKNGESAAFCAGENKRLQETLVVKDNLPGAFNAGNVLASLIVAANVLELALKDICRFIPKLTPVRGRMTAIRRGQGFELIVDYAHTPSSFETIFPPLRRRLDETGGRIISVFGSAGERDRQKRSIQGSIAAQWSDIVVLTDEDPRGEEPLAILEEIAQGIKNKKPDETLFLIPERPVAIRKAFSLAKEGDLVLLLGKGHENSIIYSRDGRGTIKYDEIHEAEKALGEMQAAAQSQDMR
ncbi:MAG: UDP-N-acetylmuramoyl-L-alanyl-D-glutamate--2,6-diaminopimelate ligase [Spirochaetaceae bacterium]|jgi:UDP-N-acetylmuramoyl-L-alanyl-D-glutamate--2,6-diaminopimelate ligase|nr:UDP-N-acetylmuramoyl-L-alanyl-D-glutamate--2,6-diaminopimelate ligase [Spirochaetaceae bacterium]